MAKHQDRDKTPADTPKADESGKDTAHEREQDRRARFARGIARSVFGRHYWDEARAKGLREAMSRKPNGGRKPQG